MYACARADDEHVREHARRQHAQANLVQILVNDAIVLAGRDHIGALGELNLSLAEQHLLVPVGERVLGGGLAIEQRLARVRRLAPEDELHRGKEDRRDACSVQHATHACW